MKYTSRAAAMGNMVLMYMAIISAIASLVVLILIYISVYRI